MTHTQKKAPLRSFFAKMTLQWRLTALTTLLVTVACIFMYFFISHSAVSGMDDLHDYVIHIDQNDSSPITFQVDPSMLFPQINDQLAQTKQLFMIKSLAVTIVVILISSLSTWFLTRKSLAPLRSLSKKISDIQAQNLSVSIDVPESHDEISKLTEAFNQMLARLNNAFDVQKQFSANAAHELRTPLAVMQTNLEVFSKKKEPSVSEWMSGAVCQPPQTQPAHQCIDHGGDAAVLQGKQHRLQKNGLFPAQRLRPALHRTTEHPFLRQRSQQADPEKPRCAAGRRGQQHRQHLARQQIPHRPAKG